MKTFRNIVILVFLLICSGKDMLYAQLIIEEPERRTYLGLGVGINEYGAGGVIEFPVSPKFYLFGNAGLGGWGLKLGGGFTYYPRREPFGPGYSFGYSYASGVKDFETELNVEPFDEQETVLLDLYQVNTINFVYSYNFRIRNSSKLSFSAGYSVPITQDTYKIKTSGIILNEESKMLMKIMEPGGLIIGLKFMFAI